MSSVPFPFITRSYSPVLSWTLLLLTVAAIAFVGYHLLRHHHGRRKAKKLGHDRRHDGRHGNH
jgi:hypothetical protein